MIFSGLTSKLVVTVFFSLASKPVVMFSPVLTLKPVVEGFLVWASKLTATVVDLHLKITATVS
jgi:hypothetical protein